MAKYTILLSGGVSKVHNYSRYKNDLEWVYRVLIEDCGYNVDNIFVLYCDGQPLQYNNQEVKSMAAKERNVLDCLDGLIDKLSENDIFTMVVSNHGGNDGGGNINLWGSEVISLEDLAKKLNSIKARKNIILGECYAGNILDYDIENSTVITANKKGLPSYSNPFSAEYDELILHFFSFIHGQYPDGTQIRDGENDLHKAYIYSCEADALNPKKPLAQAVMVDEVPQIKCDIAGKVYL